MKRKKRWKIMTGSTTFVLILTFLICTKMAGATFDQFYEKEGKDSASVFSRYLYNEGTAYSELPDEYEDVVFWSTEELEYHILYQNVELDGHNWQVRQSYYKSVGDGADESVEDGVIIDTCFLWLDDTGENGDIVIEYVQHLYGSFDFTDNVGTAYISYQKDGVEGGDYNIELVFQSDVYILYFTPGADTDYGSPKESLESLNGATSIRALAELSAGEITEEEIIATDEGLKDLQISVEVLDVVRLSALFGVTTATNNFGISEADLETCDLDAGIYIINANLNMTAYEYEDCANWDCIFVYLDGWKLLDTIWNYDLNEEETGGEETSGNEEDEEIVIIGEASEEVPETDDSETDSASSFVQLTSDGSIEMNGVTYSMAYNGGEGEAFGYYIYADGSCLPFDCKSPSVVMNEQYIYYSYGSFESQSDTYIYSSVIIYRYSIETIEQEIVYEKKESSPMISPIAVIDSYLYFGDDTQYSGEYRNLTVLDMSNNTVVTVGKDVDTIQPVEGENCLLVSATGFPHGGSLYLMDYDGGNVTLISEENVSAVEILDGCICFTEVTLDFNTRQGRCDLDGSNVEYLSEWVNLTWDVIERDYNADSNTQELIYSAYSDIQTAESFVYLNSLGSYLTDNDAVRKIVLSFYDAILSEFTSELSYDENGCARLSYFLFDMNYDGVPELILDMYFLNYSTGLSLRFYLIYGFSSSTGELIGIAEPLVITAVPMYYSSAWDAIVIYFGDYYYLSLSGDMVVVVNEADGSDVNMSDLQSLPFVMYYTTE